MSENELTEPKRKSALVQCATCGTPMKVNFENGEIVEVFAVCKCPREPVGGKREHG